MAIVTFQDIHRSFGTEIVLDGFSLDLHDGHVVARVEERHRSREFVALLKDLDAYYPAGATIRVILDNHSALISKEKGPFAGYKRNRVYSYPSYISILNEGTELPGKEKSFQ
jgi:ABC-type histidine transport system ATPase subunit